MPPRPAVPDDDLYARLEVRSDASAETIEVAWRALLKRHHPDVAGADGLELSKRINVAHDWLSDATLRERYDRERRVGAARSRSTVRDRHGTAPRTRQASPPRAAPADPARALRRFIERVGELSRDELDRLSVSDASSIAFVASIRRFLPKARAEMLEAVEREIDARLPPADRVTLPIRDAILAAAHELVLAPFLDEHLSEPFRGRARERLMRGWEAAIDQPRYGPNSALVGRFVRRATELDQDEVSVMVRAATPRHLGRHPWPAGLDPEEDEGLRVSSVLAARDAAAAPVLALIDPAAAERARRLLARTAHALVLRHAFGADTFADLVAPWTAATGDPGTGRVDEREPTGPTVRRG
jgi:curved DNA-binding protein CbpA